MSEEYAMKHLQERVAMHLRRHYEISPREREDEAMRDERDFGTQEYDDEAEQSEPRVWGDSAES